MALLCSLLILLQNDIPVFCPALTDGSIGDMIYFHSFRSPGLVLDIVGDIRALNELARKSLKAGMIVLGGGVCKHQIANALLMVRVIFSPRIDRVPDCGRAY
jgi:deoxyhypusine synthase